jgi:hypothetical protein
MALPINTASLINEMRSTLVEIDKQIVAIKRDILNHLPVHEEPDPNVVYRYKDKFGRFVLTDLLMAKANLLAGIANLQAPTQR